VGGAEELSSRLRISTAHASFPLLPKKRERSIALREHEPWALDEVASAEFALDKLAPFIIRLDAPPGPNGNGLIVHRLRRWISSE
jgi:hypothetical protein